MRKLFFCLVLTLCSIVHAAEKKERFRERGEFSENGSSKLFSQALSDDDAEGPRLPSLIPSSLPRLKLRSLAVRSGSDEEGEDPIEPGSASPSGEGKKRENMDGALSQLRAGSQLTFFREEDLSAWVVPFNSHAVYEALSSKESKVKNNNILVVVDPCHFSVAPDYLQSGGSSWRGMFKALSQRSADMLVDFANEGPKVNEGLCVMFINETVRSFVTEWSKPQSSSLWGDEEDGLSPFSWLIGYFQQHHSLRASNLLWPLPLKWHSANLATRVLPSKKKGIASARSSSSSQLPSFSSIPDSPVRPSGRSKKEPSSAPLPGKSKKGDIDVALSRLRAGSLLASFREGDLSAWVVPFNSRAVHEALSSKESKVKNGEIIVVVNIPHFSVDPDYFKPDGPSWGDMFGKLGKKFDLLADLVSDDLHSTTRESFFVMRNNTRGRKFVAAWAARKSIRVEENKEGHLNTFSWEIAQCREKSGLRVDTLIWPFPLKWHAKKVSVAGLLPDMAPSLPVVSRSLMGDLASVPLSPLNDSPGPRLTFSLSFSFPLSPLSPSVVVSPVSKPILEAEDSEDEDTPTKEESVEEGKAAKKKPAQEEEEDPVESETPGSPEARVIQFGNVEYYASDVMTDEYGSSIKLPGYLYKYPKGYKGPPLYPVGSLKSIPAPKGYHKVTWENIGEYFEKDD